MQQPWRLRDWEIPTGAAVANALSMVHRRPDLYPEPFEFRPERFLGKRPDPYEWTPFGGGVRRCLGMAFALYEMKIVLAQLLVTTNLELADPGPTRAVPRGFFIAPGKGLPVPREGAGSSHRGRLANRRTVSTLRPGPTHARKPKGRPRAGRGRPFLLSRRLPDYCVTLSAPVIEGCTVQW